MSNKKLITLDLLQRFKEKIDQLIDAKIDANRTSIIDDNSQDGNKVWSAQKVYNTTKDLVDNIKIDINNDMAEDLSTIVNDNVTGTNNTWSAQKISDSYIKVPVPANCKNKVLCTDSNGNLVWVDRSQV